LLVKSAILLENVREKYFSEIDIENCISLAGTPGIVIFDIMNSETLIPPGSVSIESQILLRNCYFYNNKLILRDFIDFDGCALYVDSESSLLIDKSFFDVSI
jgi:hypothetical protein